MSKYGIVIVDTDDTVQLIGLDDYHVSLDDLYRWSDCDTISLVHTDSDFSDSVLMCIDDNGKLLQKPINRICTLLYGALPHDFIVGKATLLSSVGQSLYDEPDCYAFPYKQAVEIYSALTAFFWA